MILKERLEELEHYFVSETNDEDTQQWRDELTEEEEKLINEWDKRVRNGIATLCEEILAQENET